MSRTASEICQFGKNYQTILSLWVGVLTDDGLALGHQTAEAHLISTSVFSLWNQLEVELLG